MAKYIKKDAQRILVAFDKECMELFYTPYLPAEVAAGRKKIEKLSNNVESMENLKSRIMKDLGNLFEDLYRKGLDEKLAPYDRYGEPILS